MPEGAVAFHHGMTLHLSQPNTSDRPRAAYTIAFMADGCIRGSPLGLKASNKHFVVERQGCRIASGAPIASAATPLAYPLPGGALPPPPPRMSDKRAASMGPGSLPYSSGVFGAGRSRM